VVKKSKSTPAILKKIDNDFKKGLTMGLGGWQTVEGGAVYQYTKPLSNPNYINPYAQEFTIESEETKVPTIGEWAEEWYEKNR